MKANINDLIVFDEIPTDYVWNNEPIYGYVCLDAKIHYEHGWRDVLIPETTNHQKLSDDFYYDLEKDIVTKKVIDFTEKEIEVYEDNLIPLSLTPRQFRLALISIGQSIDEIDSFIDSLDDNIKNKIKVIWEYSLEYNRKDKTLIQMGKMLGLTESDLNNVFKIGSTL
jgi:hypothetical protein